MKALATAVMVLLSSGWILTAQASVCGTPQELGPHPSRLVVVVPGTGQSSQEWQSFLAALRKEPQSADMAWLVFEHGIRFTSLGTGDAVADRLASCIQEKLAEHPYTKITLIGHSVGGMLARRAYLEAAGVFPGMPKGADSWSDRVDKILLFSSLNKGFNPQVAWWSSLLCWTVRTFPHPHLVLEDVWRGSDFIADIRISWIRYFGGLIEHGAPRPQIVQFWGTNDSYVSESDNADLEAFSGPVVVRVSGASHTTLIRLEPRFADDPAARWALFRVQLFSTDLPQVHPTYEPRRVLYIVRGIRDSSNSEWVADLRRRAIPLYGEGNVEDIEYGYFSAAHFALRPLRRKVLPFFRDSYAERLAENPLTEFDFIGHSNGTYILGESLLSTPSMRFRNVVLAAPVLPTEYDWDGRFRLHQVQAIRYDIARFDWPVGILCPALRALGFLDVGPSGLVLFGEGGLADSRVRKVGWYSGGHGAALSVDPSKHIDNRVHLLEFAAAGSDLTAGEPLAAECGIYETLSRATPYVVWLLMICAGVFTAYRYLQGWRPSWRGIGIVVGSCIALYALLDII